VLGIFAHVAQDVGELERHAASFGQTQRFGILETENVDDGQAHHAGDVIAVIVKFLKRLDAPRFQVRADTPDHVVKILMGNTIALYGIGERRPKRMLRRIACQRRIQILLPSCDGGRAIRHVVRIA